MPALSRPYRLILTLGGIDFVSTTRYKEEIDASDAATDLNEEFTPTVGMQQYDPEGRKWWEI